MQVQVLDMPKVKNMLITERADIKSQNMQLSEMWTAIQKQNNDGRALFGTHLQLKDNDALKSLMRKIEPWYKLNNEYDLQRFYGFELNGLNDPMFFFKSDGAWTGLHNEDCGLASFNISIGPGTSRWTLIHELQIPKLSTAVKKELKLKRVNDVRLMRHA